MAPKKKKNKKDHQMGFLVTVALKEKIETFCEESGMSFSEMVRRAIVKFIDGKIGK